MHLLSMRSKQPVPRGFPCPRVDVDRTAQVVKSAGSYAFTLIHARIIISLNLKLHGTSKDPVGRSRSS